MNYAIVTGASKGLGASTTHCLLSSGVSVIGVSRTDNDEFYQLAKENDAVYAHFKTDLSKLEAVEELLEKLTLFFETKDISTLFLVNNAAMVQPIRKSTDTSAAELAEHFQLNVVTPMAIMNHLLELSRDNVFVGANITSGAATHAYYGWSAYGSAKSSIDMYTKTVALEQRELGSTHKIFAFSPGVMDTEMQGTIRDASAEDFIDVERFKKYKQDKMLVSTDEVATILVDIMMDISEINSGKIYNVKEYF